MSRSGAGHVQRRHPPDDLAGYAERFAARRQHRHATLAADSSSATNPAHDPTRCSQLSRTTRLGVVAELDRQLTAERRAADLLRAERGERDATDRVRVGQRRQLDPPHAARTLVQSGPPTQPARAASCPRRPNRRESPAVRRRGSPAARRSRRSDRRAASAAPAGCGGRCPANAARRTRPGRSGWTNCHTCSGRPRSRRRCTPRSRNVHPVREPLRHDLGGAPPTPAPDRRGRSREAGRTGSASARRSCRRRATAPRRCARPSAPRSSAPAGHGSAINRTLRVERRRHGIRRPAERRRPRCRPRPAPPVAPRRWPAIDLLEQRRSGDAIATPIASGAASQRCVDPSTSVNRNVTVPVGNVNARASPSITPGSTSSGHPTPRCPSSTTRPVSSDGPIEKIRQMEDVADVHFPSVHRRRRRALPTSGGTGAFERAIRAPRPPDGRCSPSALDRR